MRGRSRVSYLGGYAHFYGKGDQMRLTKRGKRVRAILILAAIATIYYVTLNVWWVGDGYCWGDMTECYLGDK
jgi:hypothetical protein